MLSFFLHSVPKQTEEWFISTEYVKEKMNEWIYK